LEDNQISKLSGFEELQTLMELYLGNNLIDEIKEIINLKEL
jgi:Leucine-rich repeat (LRR) protein